MIPLAHGLWSDVLVIGLLVVLVLVCVLVSGVKLGWLRIGEKVETLEQFCRAVDQAYDDWDRYFDAGPSSLSVWVTLEPNESSGSFFRDLAIAYQTRNEPPRISLTAFMKNRRPVSVMVSAADRPAARPFATFFREGYPEKLIQELILIEWRLRLQKRWPKADVTMHYYCNSDGEPGGWRKQLEHAERYILDQQEQCPRALASVIRPGFKTSARRDREREL
jgi:hypothetical protein